MRIATLSVFNNITQNLQRLTSEMQQINESIASGDKYQNIYQNPIDLSSSLRLDTDLSQIEQYQRNLQAAERWLNDTEPILQNLDDIIKDAKVLAEQMATGTINDDNRANAVSQVETMIAGALQAANTNAQGQYLLSGYHTDIPPFVQGDDLEIQTLIAQLQTSSGYTGTASASGTYTGATATTYLVEIVNPGAVGAATFRVSEDGGQTWTTDSSFVTSASATSIWSGEGDKGVEIAFTAGGTLAAGDRFIIPVSDVKYQGDDHSLELRVGQDSRLTVNVVGRDAVDGNSGRNDIFQILTRLKSYLANDNAAGAATVLEELEQTEENLLKYQASVGAQINRVIYRQNSYINWQNCLETNLSKIEDTDLIDATEALNLKQVAYQAALLASTKVMNFSLLDYL